MGYAVEQRDADNGCFTHTLIAPIDDPGFGRLTKINVHSLGLN